MHKCNDLFGTNVVVTDRIVGANIRAGLRWLLFRFFLHEDGRFWHQLILLVVEELSRDLGLILARSGKLGKFWSNKGLSSLKSLLLRAELFRDFTLVKGLASDER